MTDGAHLGYGAEASMRAVLGADEPETGMDGAAFEAYIRAAPEPAGNYDDSGRLIAKLVLEYLLRHPEDGSLPSDNEYEWKFKADGEPDWDAGPTVKVVGLYDRIKQVESDTHERLSAIGMSGFQWGWGVNAARRCLEMPPVPNPAIVEINLPEPVR